MKNNSFASVALALAVGLTGFTTPAAAMSPRPALPSLEKATDVVGINHRRRIGRVPPGYYVRGPGVFNGYRGRRHRVPGWRHHNGWWFPPAAFALGVIIGNGLYGGGYYRVQPQPTYRYGSPPGEHYRWCGWTFKTFRAWDNTYVPRRGVRAQCRSPYWP